jgi:diadenosine tetraphosphate (Ap4A) HIT family hydrolase
MPCPACDRLTRLRTSDDPFLLAELRESFAVLHRHQPFGPRVGGWCTLWLKDHHEHLGLLPRDRQDRLASDVADLAGAMHAALAPLGMRRINYECLGNVVAHVHWHLIPRFEAPHDPNPGATVWVRPAAELDCGVPDDLRDRLVHILRDALSRRPAFDGGLV